MSGPQRRHMERHLQFAFFPISAGFCTLSCFSFSPGWYCFPSVCLSLSVLCLQQHVLTQRAKRGYLFKLTSICFPLLFVWRLSVDIHNRQLLTYAIHVLARNVFLHERSYLFKWPLFSSCQFEWYFPIHGVSLWMSVDNLYHVVVEERVLTLSPGIDPMPPSSILILGIPLKPELIWNKKGKC